MALEEFRELHEVLFRFRAGACVGVHAQYLAGVKKDGEVVSATLEPAVPVAQVEDGDKPTVDAVLGEAMAAVVARADQAEAVSAAAATIIQANEADITAKDANAQALLEQVDAVNFTCGEAEAAKAAAEAAREAALAAEASARADADALRAELIDVRGQLVAALEAKG